MNIGILGLTGNPIHLGHKEVALYALRECDEVWVCPVYQHAFGKKFIDYSHRFNMIKLMFATASSRIVIKEVDKDYALETKKMPYSYDLLKYLKEQVPQNNYKLIIGEDNYQPNVWKKFRNYDKIEAEFGVIVAPDIGAHSTNIRKMLESHDDVEKLVGQSVAQYIKNNDLYEKRA